MRNFIADARNYLERKLNPGKTAIQDEVTAELWERIWGRDPHADVHRSYALPRLRGKPDTTFRSEKYKAADARFGDARAALLNITKEIDLLAEEILEPQPGEPYAVFLKRIEDASSRKAWLEHEAKPAAEQAVVDARVHLGMVKASEAEWHADNLVPRIHESDKAALALLISALQARAVSAALREEHRLWINLVDSGERAAEMNVPSRTPIHDALRVIAKWGLLESVWQDQRNDKYGQFLVRLNNNFNSILAAIRADSEAQNEAPADAGQ